MSVKIRLTRTGKKHQASYRVIATDTRGKRDGKFLEILGFYNPKSEPSLVVKRDRFDFWTQKGAKPSEAVTKLLESLNAEKLTTNAENESERYGLSIKH